MYMYKQSNDPVKLSAMVEEAFVVEDYEYARKTTRLADRFGFSPFATEFCRFCSGFYFQRNPLSWVTGMPIVRALLGASCLVMVGSDCYIDRLLDENLLT